MSDKWLNTFGGWLRHNLTRLPTLRDINRAYDAGNGMDTLRLQVLRVLLAISCVALLALWYLETAHGVINAIDQVAYPLMLVLNGTGALLLFWRPQLLRHVVVAIFSFFILYLLVNYYYIFSRLIGSGLNSDYYSLVSLGLWLPLGYVSAFVFFSPRSATRVSLLVYAALCVPPLFLLFRGTDGLNYIVGIDSNILLSHPVYIAALWGVAQLKNHTLGVHDLALSMSAAASEDPLTGIANRRAVQQALQAVVSHKPPTRAAALMLFDVDRFKSVNDRFGHDVGDEVLIRIARTTQQHLRSGDLLGRWGGEEFIILSLGQSPQQAQHTAERLRAELAALQHPRAGVVTVSIGLTSLVPGECQERFLKRADDALYLAKNGGRNRIEALFASN